jgi:hypothetical protein
MRRLVAAAGAVVMLLAWTATPAAAVESGPSIYATQGTGGGPPYYWCAERDVRLLALYGEPWADAFTTGKEGVFCEYVSAFGNGSLYASVGKIKSRPGIENIWDACGSPVENWNYWPASDAQVYTDQLTYCGDGYYKALSYHGAWMAGTYFSSGPYPFATPALLYID